MRTPCTSTLRLANVQDTCDALPASDCTAGEGTSTLCARARARSDQNVPPRAACLQVTLRFHGHAQNIFLTCVIETMEVIIALLDVVESSRVTGQLAPSNTVHECEEGVHAASDCPPAMSSSLRIPTLHLAHHSSPKHMTTIASESCANVAEAKLHVAPAVQTVRDTAAEATRHRPFISPPLAQAESCAVSARWWHGKLQGAGARDVSSFSLLGILHPDLSHDCMYVCGSPHAA